MFINAALAAGLALCCAGHPVSVQFVVSELGPGCCGHCVAACVGLK